MNTKSFRRSLCWHARKTREILEPGHHADTEAINADVGGTARSSHGETH